MVSPINDHSEIRTVSDDKQPPITRLEEGSQLFKAVDHNDIKSLKKFLAGNPSGWKVTDEYGSTLLHHAAGRGKMGCLRYIVEKDGESISRMDSRECQPLHYAACNGKAEAVKFLLDKGADISARNKEGETPLLVACLSDDIHTVELLLDQHFRRNPSQLPPVDAAGNTVLHFSMIGNHDHVLVKLLERMQGQYTSEQMKQLVDSVNKSRQTILDMAAAQGQLSTIQQHLQSCLHSDTKQEVQNAGVLPTQQGGHQDNSLNTLLLKSSHGQNHGTDSRVTPSTDDANGLGDPVRRSHITKSIVHEGNDEVELHVVISKNSRATRV